MNAETNYALHIVSTYEEVTERTQKTITDFGGELQKHGYAINTYENLIRKTVTPGPDLKHSQNFPKIWLYILNSPAGEKSIFNRLRERNPGNAIILAGEKAPLLIIPPGVPVIDWDENNLEAVAYEVHEIISNFNAGPSDQDDFKPLKVGSSGEGVAAIQQLLQKTIMPNMAADGVFGPATREAVKAFQRKYDLEETGEVDERTFTRLKETARNADLPPAETTFEPETEQTTGDSKTPAYWILKLNPERWNLNEFIPGFVISYRPYDASDRPRPRFENFQRIAENDIVLGYAFEPVNGMLCRLRVTAGMGTSKQQDSSNIALVVEERYPNPLPFEKIASDITESEILTGASTVRLLQLTAEEYAKVTALLSGPKNGANTVVNHYSRSVFRIRDGSEPVLGVTDIAKEVSELIRNLKTKEYGRMVGIFGNWGRGKTFMVEQVWKVLEADKTNPFIRINFHAWKYQDTHASWAYLYEAFAKKYFSKDKKKSWFENFFADFKRRFNLNILRHGFWPLIRIGISAGAVVLFAWLAMQEEATDQLFKAFWLLLTTAGIADSVRLVARFFREHKIKEKATEVFKVYFEKPSFKDLLGVQSEIQNELRNLLKCWIKEQNGEPEKQILLVVDDIDRCSEDRIVQIIDALRVMLEDEEISKRVVVVAAIDERVLHRAIKWKYKELLDADRELNADPNSAVSDKWTKTTRQITSEYMDKLFLAGIKLGTLTADERIEVYEKFLHEEKPATPVEITPPPETGTDKTNAQHMYEAFRDMADPPKTGKDAGTENKASEKNTDLQKPSPVPDKKPSQNNVANKPTLTTETSFELSDQEDKILRSYVQQLYDATPRQIRIFYYRFILARNLLSISLVQRKSALQFGDDTRITLLAHLLMHYTQLRSNEQLIRDRELFLTGKGNATNSSIHEMISGHEPELVSEILEALEMVIAY